MLPRHKRGHLDGDQHLDRLRSPSLLHYRHNICEIEYPASSFASAPPLRYALPLGEIHVHRPRVDNGPPDLIGTNFFLLMDVTTPKKSLWIVFAYEYPFDKRSGLHEPKDAIGVGKFELNRNSPLCSAFGLFDMACIAESLDDFVNPNEEDMPMRAHLRGHQKPMFPQLNAEKASRMLRSTSYIAQPVLTEPNLGILTQAINQGWNK
ncbi:hypothetical protein F5Y11DRAFT_322879 [Daldinia sp. FL1419]|nr:hypothetical protein F5Y11DRAFT_322879 [Daldinia sp. FL1419]